MKAVARLKANVRRFRDEKPGERFVRTYRRAQEGRSALRRVSSIVLGIVVVAAGLVLLPAPGPGILVVAAGLGLLGRESLVVARGLDRAELKVRAVARGLRKRFSTSSSRLANSR